MVSTSSKKNMQTEQFIEAKKVFLEQDYIQFFKIVFNKKNYTIITKQILIIQSIKLLIIITSLKTMHLSKIL